MGESRMSRNRSHILLTLATALQKSALYSAHWTIPVLYTWWAKGWEPTPNESDLHRAKAPAPVHADHKGGIARTALVAMRVERESAQTPAPQKPARVLHTESRHRSQRWQLKTSECHSKRGGGNGLTNQNSPLALHTPLSHTIDMAFGDWSCHLRFWVAGSFKNVLLHQLHSTSFLDSSEALKKVLL
jgi:hypothetical protein